MKVAHMQGPVYPPRHPTSTMSTTGSFATKIAAHRRRNDSGELDVFEAARYFSSIPDIPPESGDRLTGWVGAGRRSLDLSMQHINPHHTYSYRLEKHHHHHHPKEKRSSKHKQPSSPGAKLASFLNSLFSQAYSRKNKSKSGGSGTQSARRDEEGSPNERRKRRSSISYFQTRSTKESHQSMCSSSSSGFRTPPTSKEFRDVSLPRCKVQQHKAVPGHSSHEAFDKKQDLGWGWMDGKFRLKEGFSEIPSNNQKCLKKDGREADDQTGWESDSSSDLFELKNYDLSLYSNSLPVYETTLVGPVK